MGRIGAFGTRRRALLGVTLLLALAAAGCFRPPRPPQPPQAAFSVSTAPLAASFTDESTGTITSRSWDFGDGASSTDQNPTHQYANHGDYTVTLTVTGPGGSDTESQTVAIKPPAPVASFAVEPPSGTIPLTVTVANTSTGLVDAIAWDLDGNGVYNDAIGRTATRTFDTAGSHTIGLSVTGPGGTSTASQTVVANLPPPPIASFTANPNSGTAPVTVSFTDTSTGAITSRSWDFNADGVTDDTGATPSHAFSSPGVYQVVLTVTGPGGNATASQPIVVNANTPPAVAITAPSNGAVFTAGNPLSFTGIANDAEDGNISSTIAWTSNVDGPLGNGASIQAGNLSAGAHTITASVTDPGGVSASATITITVNPAPPPLNVVLTAAPTAGVPPLLVSFNACPSTGTNLSFRWDFDNDGVDDQVNPCSAQNTYTTPGSYTAKLTLTESVPGGGQVTTTKQILVSSPPDPGGDPGDCGGRRCNPRDPGGDPPECIPPVCDPRL